MDEEVSPALLILSSSVSPECFREVLIQLFGPCWG